MQFLQVLKKEREQLKKDYRQKRSKLNDLINTYGEPENGVSDTERVKRILKQYDDKAYDIGEFTELIDLEGYDVTRSVIHQALKQLRNSEEILAFRLNKSNQSVYYMSPDGIDRMQEQYPVKTGYRPDDVDPTDVHSFEWLD